MGKTGRKKKVAQKPEETGQKKRNAAHAKKTQKKEAPPPKSGEAQFTEQAAPPDSQTAEPGRGTAIKDHLRAAAGFFRLSAEEFKKDIDPAKAEALKKETIKIMKAGAILLVAIIAVASVLILPEVYFSGKVMANTKVGGVDVSKTTPDEAKNKLMIEVERYLKTPLTFILDDQKISLSPEELGVQISVDQTLNTIPVLKFDSSNPLVIAGSFLTSRDIKLQYTCDLENAAGKIEEKLDIKDKRAKNARLIYDQGEFKITPEQKGVAIDQKLLSDALNKDFSGLKPDPVMLRTVEEYPRITAAELEGQKDRLTALLKNELTIRHGDTKFTFKPAEHLDAVEFDEQTTLGLKSLGLTLPISLGEQKIELASDSPAKLVSKLEIGMDTGKLSPFLQDNFIKNIEIPTSGVTITRQDGGNIKIEGKGENGQTVPGKRLIAGIDLAINNGIKTVPAPVITEKAPVNISDDLQQLGIKELLATGHTSFYGSHPNRIHNINVGIAKYNGVLVKPGEEFSFNKILGEVDAKNGYLPEKVIKKNKVETEYGGGICQVSTTLYRAALFAGLPITERNPHSWIVSYYSQVLGNGLDATIYLGVSDVKFINDTPAYLLVQAYAEGANAYFKFYGTSDGRTTEMEGPYGGGLHYKWYRIVKKNDQEIKETIISDYKPIPPPETTTPEKPKEIAQKTSPKPTL